MSTDLSEQILKYIEQYDRIDTIDLVPILNEDHQKIVGALKSIQANDENLLNVEQTTSKSWKLTDEGQQFVDQGSHEARVFYNVPENGIPFDALQNSFPGAKIGCSKAIASGWLFIDNVIAAGDGGGGGGGKQKLIKRKVEKINDTVREDLKSISMGLDTISDDTRKEYKKRKLVQEIVVKSFIITKGSEFKTELQKLETDLTVDMLTNGLWEKLKFKEYNFDALGAPPQRGHLHPLLKVRSEFRQIFLEMGFSEMPTNNYVESSFWNFDALFQPQQHPARDAHDTFFLSHPERSYKFPEKYLERVKEVHSHGGYGSQGYKYDWKIEEAQKNLLRTHTTAVSARMLYKLANQPEGFKSAKYFSIDRVFRNETLDATHLAEFHQVEGVIADVGVTLGDLIGTFSEFFKKLGLTQLEFKPAYNPYTEPSMEIFCFHKGLNKWIEIGNSGIFRPEMLLPMGIPANVNVIAWGLSLERPTMIKYGLNNIRDLVGPKVDLQMVQDGPICRLDK